MTAPDTNLKKQAKRHRGPLIGIIVVVLLAGGLLFWMLTRTMVTEPEPEDMVPAETTETESGLPAEGTPTDPTGVPESAPQVIEEAPAPEPEPLPGD